MRIKDVIHGEINIEEPLIKDLVQTSEFQRLRKIKQLGVTNINFPGAEHTRYTHSLGVYNVCKEILNKLDSAFTSKEALSLKVAALLHDVGHGPLSHAFESFFKVEHEEFTIKIIKNKTGNIFEILNNYKVSTGHDILEDVLSLIQKNHNNKSLNSIITSSIDADRMDYLLRDSYYTGTVYGNVDFKRIISYMEYENKQLYFTEKSIHTLEDFIMSRYHMFIQVYLNKKSLIYEELIQKILNRVFELKESNFEFKTSLKLFDGLNQTEINVEDYLSLNDYNFLSTIAELGKEDDEILRRYVFFFETKPNFFEEISKDEFDNLDELDKLTIPDICKKVYSSNDSILVKDNSQIKNIEEVSQIFDFCKNNLEIVSQKKFYKLKGLDEV